MTAELVGKLLRASCEGPGAGKVGGGETRAGGTCRACEKRRNCHRLLGISPEQVVNEGVMY